MDGDLILSNISKTYPGVKALDDVSVRFKQGEVHAIVGENGAGKSTFIKVIAGAVEPDGGTISIGGCEFKCLTPAQSKEWGVAVVYQELVQFEAMSVSENIFMGMKIGKKYTFDKKLADKKAAEVLKPFAVNISPAAAVRDLSLANRQIVEIGKAIAQNAKIVIMDEPTTSLTVEEQSKLFDIVKDLKAKGVTIIYISHRLEELFEICDRVTVFRDGKFIETLDIENTNKQELIKLMVGRELSENYPKGSEPGSEVVLKVDGLSGNGVEDISFELHRGEILGFAGLVGAGRTELMHLIFGAAKRERGSIFVGGKNIDFHSPKQGMEAGVGLIPEDRKLQGCFIDKEVYWNISISNITKLSRFGVINRKAEISQAKEYISKLQIKTPGLRQVVVNLSGGNQQKVVIAKVLATSPEIIIFDEPTRGIDVGARYEIYMLMNELAAQGKSILMVSSDMEELLGMSRRIVVLHEGRQTGILHKSEFSQEKIMTLASGI